MKTAILEILKDSLVINLTGNDRHPVLFGEDDAVKRIITFFESFKSPLSNKDFKNKAIDELKKFYDFGDERGYSNTELSRISSCMEKIMEIQFEPSPVREGELGIADCIEKYRYNSTMTSHRIAEHITVIFKTNFLQAAPSTQEEEGKTAEQILDNIIWESEDVQYDIIYTRRQVLKAMELHKASWESKQVTDSLSESDIAEQYKETAQKLIVNYINFDDPNGYFKASVQHYYEKGSATGSFNIKLSEMIYRAIHLDRIERGESKPLMTYEEWEKIFEGKNTKVPVQGYSKEDLLSEVKVILNLCDHQGKPYDGFRFREAVLNVRNSLPSVYRESLPVGEESKLRKVHKPLENETFEGYKYNYEQECWYDNNSNRVGSHITVENKSKTVNRESLPVPEIESHLLELIKAANRMRDKYSEGDEKVKSDSWKKLHNASDNAMDFLESQKQKL